MTNNKRMIASISLKLAERGCIEYVHNEDGTVTPEPLVTLTQATKQGLVLNEGEMPVTILPLWHFVPAKKDANNKIVRCKYFFARETNLYSYRQFSRRVA